MRPRGPLARLTIAICTSGAGGASPSPARAALLPGARHSTTGNLQPNAAKRQNLTVTGAKDCMAFAHKAKQDSTVLLTKGYLHEGLQHSISGSDEHLFWSVILIAGAEDHGVHREPNVWSSSWMFSTWTWIFVMAPASPSPAACSMTMPDTVTAASSLGTWSTMLT